MNNGHFISNDMLTKLGHRILSTSFAAYEYEKLYREADAVTRDPDPLDHLRAYEESEISENLITLASLARADDDQWETLKYGDITFPDGVGTLKKKGESNPLKVREACNKIIHANTMTHDFSRTERHPIWQKWYRSQRVDIKGDFLAPAIILTGTSQSGIDWEARLELISYVYAVSIPSINTWNLA